MYGLSYCRLDYDTLMEMDLDLLGIYIKAEIDREVHEYDMEMRRLAWQTAYLMNSTGNYKSAVKPEKLYTPLDKIKEQQQQSVQQKKNDVQAQKEELKKTFGLS